MIRKLFLITVLVFGGSLSASLAVVGLTAFSPSGLALAEHSTSMDPDGLM
jgi:hypothetical protein